MDLETGKIIVLIEDRGVGIPFEFLDRIKDPFFTTKQSSGNTGLGLAISDRIVENHGGRLRFTSFPGKGTSARLYFPIQKA
ncbi:hypothetical protein KKA14_08280 [bacterium]|nr:hypothetical protein [bacterium]